MKGKKFFQLSIIVFLLVTTFGFGACEELPLPDLGENPGEITEEIPGENEGTNPDDSNSNENEGVNPGGGNSNENEGTNPGGNSSTPPVDDPEEETKPTSEGLEYTLSDDGTYYSVTAIGTCTDGSIVIPATYND